MKANAVEDAFPGHRREEITPKDLLVAEEAAAYLGIEPRRLPAVAEQYGFGRRYRADPRPGWFYARPELDEVLASPEFQATKEKA